MATNKDLYYQSETITFPIGTTARTMTKEIILRSDYDRCIGIAVFESQTGGIPFYRIGLDDKDQQYISAVHKDLLISDKAAGMLSTNRFMPISIKAASHKVKVNTQLPKELTEILEYDIVFLLERKRQK